MKKLIIILLAFVHFTTQAQSTFAGEGSFTGSPELFTLTQSSPLSQLASGNVYQLHIGFVNNSMVDKIPNNTTEIHIKLGTNLIVADNFNLQQTQGAAAFFDWYAWTDSDGNKEIWGIQKSSTAGDIPAGTAFVATFHLKATGTGTSQISASIVYHNANQSQKNVDPVMENNNAALTYSVASTLPVTFTGVNAIRHNCSVQVSWVVAQEVNVRQYELQGSRNGSTWETINRVQASGKSDYAGQFDVTTATSAADMLIRIKAIDFDGKITYSNVVRLNTQCYSKGEMVLYPNPVSTGNITVVTTALLPRGTIITLQDQLGRTYGQQVIKDQNVTKVQLPLPISIKPGVYQIQISQPDQEVKTLKFVKM